MDHYRRFKAVGLRYLKVLHERQAGYHFLEIHYPETQNEDNANVTQMNDRNVLPINSAHCLASLLDRIVPHPRTLA